eukprot:CAMPEP_0203959586 /NCGR_PEP_ID=MMETSP0359-20131031/90580_1 /ASSEMBLY_ACC=CAM_ASM_000338 /TAXON_ID=268821 /ORGANISM="Scrippsiella Hangoei, Strain SHTV-5" /LENGTH=40 /DNA_ID= /DNA_START= /DNA_END= /DNA_ORIENTATION=
MPNTKVAHCQTEVAIISARQTAAAAAAEHCRGAMAVAWWN